MKLLDSTHYMVEREQVNYVNRLLEELDNDAAFPLAGMACSNDPSIAYSGEFALKLALSDKNKKEMDIIFANWRAELPAWKRIWYDFKDTFNMTPREAYTQSTEYKMKKLNKECAKLCNLILGYLHINTPEQKESLKRGFERLTNTALLIAFVQSLFVSIVALFSGHYLASGVYFGLSIAFFLTYRHEIKKP